MTTETSDSENSDTSTEQPLFKPSVGEFPWLLAGLTSFAALFVEYITIALLFVLGPSSVASDSPREVLLQFAFLLYNAHFVPTVTRATSPDMAVGGEPATNILLTALLTGASTQLPPELFFVVPIVLLLMTGWLFERYRPGPRGGSLIEEGALVGTGIALGYVITGAIGAFVFVRPLTAPTGATAVEVPSMQWILVTMFLLPLVFATTGAVLAAYYDSKGTTAPAQV